MQLQVIPAALRTLPNVRPILTDGRSSVLHKTLSENLVDIGKYVATTVVVYLVRGSQCIHGHGGSRVTLEEGSLVFLPRGVYVVSDYLPESGAFEALLFFIDDRVIEQFLRTARQPGEAAAVPPESGASPCVLHADPQVRRYAEAVLDVYLGAPNSAPLLELKLLELLHLIALQDDQLAFIRALSSGKAAGRRPITEFMEAHASHHLTVAHYASLSGRSVSAFLREFKKAYLTTPNRWLMDRRLAEAHRQLTDGAGTVTSAALEAGYDNVSHFIRAYKRRYGVTPGAARRAGEVLAG